MAVSPTIVIICLCSSVVLAGCGHTAADPPEGGCSYRRVDAQCTLAEVVTETTPSDDTLAVRIITRYESAPIAGAPSVAPRIDRFDVPREREAPIREHFQAHREAPCRVAILVDGACPPDSTQVESVELPPPPLVVAHAAVSRVVLSSARSPTPTVTLTPAQGQSFASAVSILEQHGFFERWPERSGPPPAPPPDAISVDLADGTTRTIGDEPVIGADPDSQFRAARFGAIRHALGVELVELPSPWRL